MSQVRNRKHRKRGNRNNNKNVSIDSKKYSKVFLTKKSNVWPTSFIVLALLSLIVYNDLQFNFPSITRSISTRKAYTNIEQFYPYYLNEHTHPDNQRMHVFGSTLIVLIGIMKPEIVITSAIGLLSGIIVFPLFRGFDHGGFEALVVVLMALFVSHKHGIKKYMLLVTIIGYGCAWFGHFHFEKNKPATFIYPSYSLVCDYKMWGAYYKQLLSTNDWEGLWAKGINFNDALGKTAVP